MSYNKDLLKKEGAIELVDSIIDWLDEDADIFRPSNPLLRNNEYVEVNDLKIELNRIKNLLNGK